MTRSNARAATARRFCARLLAAGLLGFCGCEPNPEGTVVLKKPLDVKDLGKAPKTTDRASRAPEKKNVGKPKPTFAPG